VVLSLTPSGRAAHSRANLAFEEANQRFLAGLVEGGATYDDVRGTIRMVAHAAEAASHDLRHASIRRAG
jgi:hypothetical protein